MHATAHQAVGKPVVPILAHPAADPATYPTVDFDAARIDAPRHSRTV